MVETVGQRLASLRKLSNISQAEVGRRLKRSKQFVWALENDKIRLEYLLAVELSNIYNVPLTHFNPDYILKGNCEDQKAI